MTEREYILVGALARCRSVSGVLRDFDVDQVKKEHPKIGRRIAIARKELAFATTELAAHVELEVTDDE
jgi:hypothetical protein